MGAPAADRLIRYGIQADGAQPPTKPIRSVSLAAQVLRPETALGFAHVNLRCEIVRKAAERAECSYAETTATPAGKQRALHFGASMTGVAASLGVAVAGTAARASRATAAS